MILQISWLWKSQFFLQDGTLRLNVLFSSAVRRFSECSGSQLLRDTKLIWWNCDTFRKKKGKATTTPPQIDAVTMTVIYFLHGVAMNTTLTRTTAGYWDCCCYYDVNPWARCSALWHADRRRFVPICLFFHCVSRLHFKATDPQIH